MSSSRSKYPNLNKFNYNADPILNIQTLLSNSIKSIQISPHGVEGVLLLETEDGAIVLKCNNQAPSEQFFTKMAKLLGLNTPNMYTIACYESIYKKLVFQIEKFVQRDEGLYARLQTRLDFPFYQIIQYIPSISMAEIGQKKFQKHLKTDSILRSIGMCLGFDMLINNGDRFKLLWNNNGNINNILIEVLDWNSYSWDEIKDRNNVNVNLGSLFFIDHEGCLLNLHEKYALDNFSKHISKVLEFHQQVINFLQNQALVPKLLYKLDEQIHFFTKYTLEEQDYRYICEGIVYMTNNFLNCYENGLIVKIYEDLKKNNQHEQKTNKKSCLYWDNYWNQHLDRIKIQHLEQNYIKLVSLYTTYDPIVQKISEKVSQDINQQENKLEEISIKHTQRQQISRGSSKLKSQSQIKNSIDQDQQYSNLKQKNPQLEGKRYNQKIFKPIQSPQQKQKGWRHKIDLFKASNYK